MEIQIQVSDIQILNRIRKDLGDIPALAKSIQENGLIEPIVLTHDYVETQVVIKLVAGERRLTALKALGLQTLNHAEHFVWRSELEGDDPKKRLLASSIEMEENLRRKDLTWLEIIEGKARLLKIMQEIHGIPSGGRPTTTEIASGTTGFGVRKLAEMLGESAAQTSQDLELAALVEKLPVLKNEATREDARKFVQKQVISYLIASRAAQVDELKSDQVILYEGPFQVNISKIPDDSIDLIYTDLPYGVNLSKMSQHQASSMVYEDSRDSVVAMLPEITAHAFRILAPNRFAVFFFGMNYYNDLVAELICDGFHVNPVCFIWNKKTSSTANPNSMYANSYDQALVASKGSPIFVKPGQRNLVDITPVYNKEHIAQQPVELVTKFIEDMTLPNSTIVDFMAGSGTTGVAAIKSKRKAILFEKEPQACNLIKVRLAQAINEELKK